MLAGDVEAASVFIEAREGAVVVLIRIAEVFLRRLKERVAKQNSPARRENGDCEYLKKGGSHVCLV